MGIVQISDYADFNQPPWLIQWMADGDVGKIAAATDRQFNDLETVLFQFLDEFGLDSATGDRLDIWGSILNVSRADRNDDNYRTLLMLKAHLNQATGTPEDLITAIATLFAATDVVYTPDFPAKVVIEHDGTEGLAAEFDWVTGGGDFMVTGGGDQLVFEVSDPILDNLVQEIVPAGVGLTINHL